MVIALVCNAFVSAGRDETANDVFRVNELVQICYQILGKVKAKAKQRRRTFGNSFFHLLLGGFLLTTSGAPVMTFEAQSFGKKDFFYFLGSYPARGNEVL